MSLAKSLELDVILEQVKRSCSFSLGEQLIEETEPSFDPLVIRRENALCREALAAVIHIGPMPFYGITDLRGVYEDAKRGRILTSYELGNICRMIRGVRSIKAYEKSLEIEHPRIKDLVELLSNSDALEKKISACINEYGEVMDSASPELYAVRKELSRADSRIQEAVSRFIAAHGSSVVDNIVTYRNGRAVILVKAGDKNTFGGLVYGDSASGQASYVEPNILFNANNRKQELMDKEAAEVEKILRALSLEAGKYADAGLSDLETLAILDALFAKAAWGAERDAVAADLSEEKRMELIGARHPLIDKDKVVANNYRIIDPIHTLLITGPNTGGKTVSMKIIGLFTLMTYCGIPITCERAVLPYFDHVYADIGDDQSVVSSLSSFSSSIRKISEIIEKAGDRSLVLLDEIGSGTDPREGESLAIAVLNELRKRETMTVCTTHYGRLKSYGKRHADILLASVQFDMEKLEPTYRYIEGLTGQSNALAVAEKYGLPKNITNYARFLINQAKTEEDHLIERLEVQVSENETLRRELAQKEEELKNREEELTGKEKTVAYNLETWRDKAKAEAEAIREEAREEADEILANMRKMSAASGYHEVLKERKKLDVQEEKENTEEDHVYQVGDLVELRNTSQYGRITSIRKKDITVNVNGRNMHVKAAQIRPSSRHIAKVTNEPVFSIRSSVTTSISLECNLIGLRVDEAMDELSEYLDQAKLNGLKTFRIIHGDGSGALRKAVHNKLEHTSGIDSYRIGMPQEGGTGATVVTMKG